MRTGDLEAGLVMEVSAVEDGLAGEAAGCEACGAGTKPTLDAPLAARDPDAASAGLRGIPPTKQQHPQHTRVLLSGKKASEATELLRRALPQKQALK
jgi:hypothetical protein